jgi:hypothetical protein
MRVVSVRMITFQDPASDIACSTICSIASLIVSDGVAEDYLVKLI